MQNVLAKENWSHAPYSPRVYVQFVGISTSSISGIAGCVASDCGRKTIVKLACWHFLSRQARKALSKQPRQPVSIRVKPSQQTVFHFPCLVSRLRVENLMTIS